jgi:membrane peptidoglycan carboxypeptidase
MRRVLFLLGLIAMVGVSAAAAAISQLELTDPEEVVQTSYLCGGNLEAGECNADNAMARLGNRNSQFVPLDEMPDHLINAVIAVEDRNFWEHQGVSVPAIARALFQDVAGSGAQQGGSTITQQYIKNAFLTSEQTYDRKIREAVLAMKLEQTWTKEEILEAYLNTIWMGRSSIGMQGAARAYFGKDVQDLDMHESALLAGLIRAPELADPHREPEEAHRRRETALDAMLEEGYITEDEHTLANAVAWDHIIDYDGSSMVEVLDGDDVGAEYVVRYVNAQLQEMGYSEEEITGGGLRVYTTLDMELQRAAYESIYHPEHGILNEEGDPPAALASLDDRGNIVAMVAGRDWNDYEVNLAAPTAASNGFPVGSTFKPIALAAAVQEGYSLTRSTLNSPGRIDEFDTTFDGEPIEGCGSEWDVGNYGDTEHEGRLNLLDITATSSNTGYAHMMMELHPNRVNQMARDLGWDGALTDCVPGVLGTADSTPLEMAEVYSVFANHGTHFEPRLITRVERVDAEGEVTVDWETSPAEDSSREVMAPDRADLVTHALRQVVENGTGTGAAIDGWHVAGKTGTTGNSRDAWFVGYVPGFTTAVWMGYPEPNWDDPRCDPAAPDPDQYPHGCTVRPPMAEPGFPVRGIAVTGGSFPTDIWQRYMARALEGQEPRHFNEPTEEDLQAGLIMGELDILGVLVPHRWIVGRIIDGLRQRRVERDHYVFVAGQPVFPGCDAYVCGQTAERLLPVYGEIGDDVEVTLQHGLDTLDRTKQDPVELSLIGKLDQGWPSRVHAVGSLSEIESEVLRSQCPSHLIELPGTTRENTQPSTLEIAKVFDA